MPKASCFSSCCGWRFAPSRALLVAAWPRCVHCGSSPSRAAESICFSLRAEHALVLQPGDTAIGPGRTGQAALADTESVAAIRIDMQLRCHVGPLQG